MKNYCSARRAFRGVATVAAPGFLPKHRPSCANLFSAAQPAAVTLGVYRPSRSGTTPAGEAARKGTV
jgi:hypothetical protein